jgi:mono/diheme cytochrome c family protein
MTRIILVIFAAFLGGYLFWSCSDMGDELPPGFGPPPVSGVSYTEEILPIFESRCTSCHNPQLAVINGNLDLTTYDTMMDTIGPHAPVITPFDAENSFLVKRIEANGVSIMPPTGGSLTAPQIALIRQWIDEGALESGGPPPPPQADSVSYTNEIQPIFDDHCTTCHGLSANGELDLRSYSGLIDAIGPHAPVVVTGDSVNSFLVQRIKGNLQPQMPWELTPLTSVQINLICLWIEQGAVNDSTGGGGGGSDTTYYGQAIQPIFDQFCVACHASPESPDFGLLDMSSYAGVMDSTGPHAPIVIPGAPTESYLLQKIEGSPGISGDRMPPGGPYLSAALTDTISQWIADGAQGGGGGGGGSGPVSFAADILPLLEARCATAGCHIQPEPPENLFLDSYAHVMGGSENGDIVVSGNSGSSLLYTLCLPSAGEDRMPQDGPWLAEGQTDMIAEWIDDGAPNN